LTADCGLNFIEQQYTKDVWRHNKDLRLTKIAREIIDGERDGIHGMVMPKDAATLIIIDRSASEPKVLLGRRHTRHKFMPGKFVFPGGRLDASDHVMPVVKPLHPAVERKLLAQLQAPAQDFARALALAAIRETFEETGLVIGARGLAAGAVPAGPWTKFVQTGFYPDPSMLQFITRAITPPGFPHRFDARFLCVDLYAIAHRLPDVIHAGAELTELIWLPIAAAHNLNLPIITSLVLDELETRLQAGFQPELPVAFYCHRDDDFTRELIV
jgi:8-oxo-dGTP pyrophosphatase MutT (NUDIX family)